MHLPSWLGIEEARILGNVVVLIAGHFRKSIVSFENGQSFAEELQSFGLEKLAKGIENRK